MFRALSAAGRGAGANFRRIRVCFTYEKLLWDDFVAASFFGAKKNLRRGGRRAARTHQDWSPTQPFAPAKTIYIPYSDTMTSPQTDVLITVDGKMHTRHVLTPGDYTIGRNAVCPIRVDADLVSRQHAKLILNYGHAHTEDLGSSSGTTASGQPISKDGRTRLWPNREIQIGTATIELRRLRHEAADVSPAPSAAMVKRALPEEFLRKK